MIDIHCHILPGIDGGARFEKEAIEMGWVAVNSGVRAVIATPYYKKENSKNEKPFIRENIRQLNQLFQALNLPLDILPGQEVDIYRELLQDLEKGKLQTLNNSKYLLLALPLDHLPDYTEQLLFDIQLAGITPIIAQPERNQELLKEPNKLYKLISQGALAQATAGSFTGVFGRDVKRVTRQMLQHNLIHFIASDTHNLRPYNLKPHNFTTLKKSYQLIQKRYGTSTKAKLQENAQLLINNENVNRDEPLRIQRKKKLFGLF